MTKLKDAIKQKTHVAIILDKSGSMQSIYQFALDTVNEQIQTFLEQSKNQDITLTLTTFNYNPEILRFKQDCNEVKQLVSKEYFPNGGTALNDAIGTTVSRLEAENDDQDENTAYLVVIISDGYENASREYSGEKIRELISRLEETGKWTFTYLGANQTPEQIHKSYGITRGNISSFSTSGGNATRKSMVNKSRNSSFRYLKSRACGAMSSQNFYGEVAEKKEENNEINTEKANQ